MLICGLQYWQHLFALDFHLTWFEQNNLLEIGHWAQRKRSGALEHQHCTTIELEGLGVPLAELEHEWEAQVKAQLISTPCKQ